MLIYLLQYDDFGGVVVDIKFWFENDNFVNITMIANLIKYIDLIWFSLKWNNSELVKEQIGGSVYYF